MDRGFVKIHRKLRDHELWKEKPFAKATAWIDLIMMANHDNCTLEASQRFLARRWGWTHKKVRSFLKYLVRNEMIKIDNKGAHPRAHKTAHIKLLNYNKFHGRGAHPRAHLSTQIEEIEELNTKRQAEIEKTIVELCQVLSNEKIFPKAFSFAGRMRKENMHPAAIIYALTMCAEYKPKDPYPYCKKIVEKETPNFRESEYHLRSRDEYGRGRRD